MIVKLFMSKLEKSVEVWEAIFGKEIGRSHAQIGKLGTTAISEWTINVN